MLQRRSTHSAPLSQGRAVAVRCSRGIGLWGREDGLDSSGLCSSCSSRGHVRWVACSEKIGRMQDLHRRPLPIPASRLGLEHLGLFQFDGDRGPQTSREYQAVGVGPLRVTILPFFIARAYADRSNTSATPGAPEAVPVESRSDTLRIRRRFRPQFELEQHRFRPALVALALRAATAPPSLAR